MRDHVKEFAEAMEAKLKTRDEDRGTEGWLGSDCSVRSLKNDLVVEMRELTIAIDDCHPENLEEECIDVGNFAMMIRSRIRAIRQGHPLSLTNK